MERYLIYGIIILVSLGLIASRIYAAGGNAVELEWAEAKAEQRKKDEAKIHKDRESSF